MELTKLKSLLIAKNATIKEAMQRLNQCAEKILFVVDEEERLVGAVTDGDIRRGLIKGTEFATRIENIMHHGCISLKHSGQDLEARAKRIIIDKKVEQIPVLDDNGSIVDVILWTDILTEKEHLTTKQLQPNQVVIMAGGKGTRLDPFTKILPKPLIPIGEKPVIEVIMDGYYKCGFHKFIYTLNYKKEYLKLFLKEGDFPYSIDYVEESKFFGTAGGLSLLKDKMEDTFFVSNCDSILDVDFEEVLDWHREHGAAITIVGCHNEVKIPFGVLEISDGRLDKILEKPSHDMIINTGVYIMEPHVISYIPEGEYMDMNQLIDLVSTKEKVTVFPVSGGWFDIGQWAEYKKSLQHLNEGFDELF